MEIPISFYKVVNEVKPHCLTCGKNYRNNATVCTETVRVGNRNQMCEGVIIKDMYLDWSINLLKDYSVSKSGNLDFFNETWEEVQKRIDGNKSKLSDSAKKKINTSTILENIMRAKGIQIVSLTGQNGDLITKSVYILPAGTFKISNFGLEDIKRFEKVRVMSGDSESDYVGYMTFTELEDGEDINSTEELPKTIDNKPEIVDILTCKACGFVAKSKIGLISHLNKHEKQLQEAAK